MLFAFFFYTEKEWEVQVGTPCGVQGEIPAAFPQIGAVIFPQAYIKTVASKLTIMEAVSRQLSELMTERNLTMNGLAYISAVPPSTVKNIFYGKSRNTGIVTLRFLCDGINITVAEFFDTQIFCELEAEDI